MNKRINSIYTNNGTQVSNMLITWVNHYIKQKKQTQKIIYYTTPTIWILQQQRLNYDDNHKTLTVTLDERSWLEKNTREVSGVIKTLWSGGLMNAYIYQSSLNCTLKNFTTVHFIGKLWINKLNKINFTLYIFKCIQHNSHNIFLR